MKLTTEGYDLLKSFEQLRLEAYLPTPNDVPTIGWGTTFGVSLGDTIDFKTAQVYLERDVKLFEDCVNKRVKVTLTQQMFNALVILCYNIGCTNFGSSTLVKLLNQGDYLGAAGQFKVWNKQRNKKGELIVLNGLTARREKEKVLFLSGGIYA